jgi:hypothetical protein|tara:strand:- start:1237 stop:1446 length:210 start_codon:yes stop_codon:yes gene_type:complete
VIDEFKKGELILIYDNIPALVLSNSYSYSESIHIMYLSGSNIPDYESKKLVITHAYKHYIKRIINKLKD